MTTGGPTSGQGPQEKKPDAPQEGLIQFLTHNKWDALAYIVLLCGLLFSIFERFQGGLIVGCVLGLYFSSATREWLIQFKEFLADEGIFRGFVLIAGLIALFMASPGLVIGALVGAFLRPYLGDSLSSGLNKDKEEKK